MHHTLFSGINIQYKIIDIQNIEYSIKKYTIFDLKNLEYTIYMIKQDIHIYLPYSRPSGWTEWADFFLLTLMGGLEC